MNANAFLTMKNKLIFLRHAAAALCWAAALTSCGGKGNDSASGSASTEGGLAPAKVNGNIRMTPMDANVNGAILLTDTPARAAYFNPPSTTASSAGAFTGNYTYTKCGPNMVELKMDNVRQSPIQTADDTHWTIIGYMTFISADQVVFTGTETFVGNTASEGGELNAQSPMGTRNFSLNYTFTMGN